MFWFGSVDTDMAPYPGETLRIQSSALISKPGETTQVQSLHLLRNLEADHIESTATFELENGASQPIAFNTEQAHFHCENEWYFLPYQPDQALKFSNQHRHR